MMSEEKMKLTEKVKSKTIDKVKGFRNSSKTDYITVGSDSAAINKSGGFVDKVKGLFSNDTVLIETSAEARQWSDEWPKHMNNYHDVYEKVSLVRKCINLLSDFSVAIGFDINSDSEEVEEEIREMWDRTNFPEIIKKAIKNREIWGCAAFHIVTDDDGKINNFVPLHPDKLVVIIDPDTMEISGFEYTTVRQGKIELEKEDVFYVTKDSLFSSQKGVSSLESIKTTIKRKWNLEKDMEQAAKRLWAPYNIFQYNTSYMKDEEEQKKEIKRFINKIGPGKTIVHNQNVEPNLVDMTPDLSALNTAIISADEEIIGNWGIPKALVSRERTEDMSTLEFALQAMYEGPIASIQQYFKKEIERQIYKQIADALGIEDTNPVHIWNANKFHDSPTIRALTYSVKEGVISPEAMIEMLGWNAKSLDANVDDKAEPRERVPPDERPVTMKALKNKLSNVLDEDEIEELEERGIFRRIQEWD